MTEGYFIAGEWGSTFMRLHLCRSTAAGCAIVASAQGVGVAGCTDFEAAFFATAQPWFDSHGPLPVILAGMVGGNIGWRDSGYAACPVASHAVAPLRFTARGIDIAITPGLSCRNMFNLPDVVRGEEMVMFGWLDSQTRSADERHVLCLPGRHVKWVTTTGAQVESFFTGMNGELEDILLRHSLLGRGVIQTQVVNEADFATGLDLMFNDRSLAMGHALFATRSRLVLGEHPPETAASFLSGLLIGGDIRDALTAYQARGGLPAPIVVLGESDLAARYIHAIKTFGCDAVQATTPHLAIQGLARLFTATQRSDA